jgi:hypothetical protein
VAERVPSPDAGAEKQRPPEGAKKAGQAGPHGKRPHEIAERANMKRRQKTHEQDDE